MPTYTPEEVAKHNTLSDLWLIINGKVHDVSSYVENHPGGQQVLQKVAGKDATKEFAESHSSRIPQFISTNYVIGELAPGTAAPTASDDEKLEAKKEEKKKTEKKKEEKKEEKKPVAKAKKEEKPAKRASPKEKPEVPETGPRKAPAAREAVKSESGSDSESGSSETSSNEQQQPAAKEAAEDERSVQSDNNALRRNKSGSGSGMVNAKEKLKYTLTRQQEQIIPEVWAAAVKSAGGKAQLGQAIYRNILQSLTQHAALFKSPIATIGFRLAGTLERVVNNLDRREAVEQELHNLSMRHISFVDVKTFKESQQAFQDCLVFSIGQQADESWSDEVRVAFEALFQWVGDNLGFYLEQYAGKTQLVRDSWGKLMAMGGKTEARDADGELAQKADGGDRTGGFGEALYFNLNVMSMEITALFTKPREELADAFTRMFDLLVHTITEPAIMKEELFVLAARHLNYGTEEKYFPVFGQAVMVTLRSLLPREWTRHHEDSWTWFWNLTSEQLSKAISTAVVSRDLVDEAMKYVEELDMSMLGQTFYTALFSQSTEVQAYFYKPNSIMKFILNKVIDMISKILHEPDQTTHEVRSVGLRHIKYGIPSDFFPLFGDAIKVTMRKWLPEIWTEDMEEAWMYLFNFVREAMTRAVLTGTNLVTTALVENSVELYETAMESAPRIDRARWLLEVDVGGIRVSPLEWSIEEGKLTIAQHMLNDLLEIRADRNRYYCGKDYLFRVHPDLTKLLARLAPTLIPTLLDGLMWHSRQIHDGKRRVNYYIRDLYGDPTADVYTTPLADIKDLNDANLFTHPLLETLVATKWRLFGFRKFVQAQVLHLILLIAQLLGYTALPLIKEACLDGDSAGARLERAERECFYAESFGFRMAAVVLALYGLLVQLWRIGKEVYNRTTTQIPVTIMGRHLFTLALPFFFTQRLLNNLKLLANVCLVVAGVSDPYLLTDTGIAPKTAYSLFYWTAGIASLLLWLLAAEVFQLSYIMIRYQGRVSAMLPKFAVVSISAMIIIMAFSSAIILTKHDPGTPSRWFHIGDTYLALISAALGAHHFAREEFSEQARAYYMIFIVLCTILLVRAGVAIFADATLEATRSAAGMGTLQRASVMLEKESGCSTIERQRYFDSMNFRQRIEFDEGDEGIAGGIQVLEVVSGQSEKRDDRIRRYPGDCSETAPWPKDSTAGRRTDKDRTERLEVILTRTRKTLNDLTKRIGGRGGLPALSESGEQGRSNTNGSRSSQASQSSASEGANS